MASPPGMFGGGRKDQLGVAAEAAAAMAEAERRIGNVVLHAVGGHPNVVKHAWEQCPTKAGGGTLASQAAAAAAAAVQPELELALAFVLVPALTEDAYVASFQPMLQRAFDKKSPHIALVAPPWCALIKSYETMTGPFTDLLHLAQTDPELATGSSGDHPEAVAVKLVEMIQLFLAPETRRDVLEKELAAEPSRLREVTGELTIANIWRLVVAALRAAPAWGVACSRRRQGAGS